MSPKATILLVEDEIFTRRMMQIYFENEGYDVALAGSAQEAITCLNEQAVDLVISDIMMPEISGLDLLKSIRDRFSKETLPVIMVTGLDDAKQIVKSMDLGANDFLTKTKEFRIILERVALHLEWKRLKQQAVSSGTMSPSREPEEGSWMWNLNGGKVRLSKRWKAVLGFEDHQMESSMDAWFSRIHPEDFARVSKAIGDHQNRKTESFEEDYRIQAADQSYIWVRNFGMAIFDREGKPVWMVGSLSRLRIDEGHLAKRAILERQMRALEESLHALRDAINPEANVAQKVVREKAQHLLETLRSLH